MVRVEDVMGTTVMIDVRDGDLAGATLDEVFSWLRFVDATFSTYRLDSEISRVGRGELELADAHEDVRGVLARCNELRAETGGYFDAHTAGALDPSGLVKGWSIDRAAELLDRAGARNYAINAGGDILVRGGALPERHWRVGIQHPEERASLARAMAVTELAVATSGAYERGCHVLDPHTRRPPTGVLSVTVTGPELGTADAYATAAYAMGEAGPRWTARLPAGYDALTILADGRVLTTPGFPAP